MTSLVFGTQAFVFIKCDNLDEILKLGTRQNSSLLEQCTELQYFNAATELCLYTVRQ